MSISFCKKQNPCRNRGNYFTLGNYLGNSCCKCVSNSCSQLKVRKPPPLTTSTFSLSSMNVIANQNIIGNEIIGNNIIHFYD
jgi:hypothetical protein